jgi:hypothetical protein
LALYGTLPEEAKATAASLQRWSSWFLGQLSRRYESAISNFADSNEVELPRRLRQIGQYVRYASLALLSWDAEDPIAIWELPRFEVAKLLETRNKGATEASLVREFYEDVTVLYGNAFEAGRARATFRKAITFLRWAEQVSRGI